MSFIIFVTFVSRIKRNGANIYLPPLFSKKTDFIKIYLKKIYDIFDYIPCSKETGVKGRLELQSPRELFIGHLGELNGILQIEGAAFRHRSTKVRYSYSYTRINIDISMKYKTK